jgi:hypothetical protein
MAPPFNHPGSQAGKPTGAETMRGGDRQQGLHTFTGAHKARGGLIWPFRGTNLICSFTEMANALFPIDLYSRAPAFERFDMSNLSKAI